MNKTHKLLSLSILAMANAGAAVIWNAGNDDDAQQYNFGNRGSNPGGGGRNVENARENGLFDTGLPGNPANVGGADGDANRDVDDDYYFAGNYGTTVGGAYTGVGIVPANESVMERAWTGGDTELRFHFNIPGSVSMTDALTVGFGVTSGFHNPGPDPTVWDIEVSMNGVVLLNQAVTVGDANADWVTPTFNIADVGGAAIMASDFDNYVTLSASKSGPGNWVSLDYAEMSATAVPEPSSSGLALLSIAALGFIRRRK